MMFKELMVFLKVTTKEKSQIRLYLGEKLKCEEEVFQNVNHASELF